NMQKKHRNLYQNSTSLQNPFDKIKVPTIATNNQADFEAESAVIIGKTCKNVDREDALQYDLGYTVGNDVSARKWQAELISFLNQGTTLQADSLILTENPQGVGIY
ncbi:5923_t:CDS:2, partial [Funneliformis geosporum]